jgi:DNA-binding NtrC family response regulator
LENVLQRAIVMAEKDIITNKELPVYIQCLDDAVKFETESVDFSRPLLETVQDIAGDVERQIILKALHRCAWNRTEAALLLRISRKSLFNKMKKHNLLHEEEPPHAGV